jgi:hypothetical protein
MEIVTKENLKQIKNSEKEFYTIKMENKNNKFGIL